MYGCYVEVVFHFVAKAILFLCFFGFDIYPYILFYFFKCFFIILVYIECSAYNYMYRINSSLTDWYGTKASGVKIANYAGHCLFNLVNVLPMNWNRTVYKVYGKQDKSGENKSNCPAVRSIFPQFSKGTVCLVIVTQLPMSNSINNVSTFNSPTIYMYCITKCTQKCT